MNYQSLQGAARLPVGCGRAQAGQPGNASARSHTTQQTMGERTVTSKSAVKSAVVIVTDGGFLLPSIVLATSIAREPRYRALCDVLVFGIDLSAGGEARRAVPQGGRRL